MSKDQPPHLKVGDGLAAPNSGWNFKGETAENFDGHVRRSVPFYDEGHKLICDMSDFFVKEDSVCYELGSSTAELTMRLAAHNQPKAGARFIGIEIEADMVRLAEAKRAAAGAKNASFIQDDILQHSYESSDFIAAYYTVQFVRPSERQNLFDKIYNSLKWGGAFVLFEKVRANDARFQDIAVSLYNEYKLEKGYSPEEIFAKSRSLKGVLEPFSTQGNLDLLKRAGFTDILPVFKYVSFEGFLAIK